MPGRGVDALKGVAGILVAVAVWELLRAASILPRDVVPSVTKIVPTFFSQTFEGGGLADALGQTAKSFAVGMGVTMLIGIPVGLLVGLSRWADGVTAMVFDFMRPVPAVAFVPVAIVFFGLDLKMQVFLICLGAVWPLIINTRFGVRGVDPLQLDTARTLGLGPVARARRVTLPAALPAVFTGIRTSAAIAVVLTVVSEIVASGTGVGGYINAAQQADLSAQGFAGLLMAGLFGYGVYLIVDVVESRAIAWHHQSTGAAR